MARGRLLQAMGGRAGIYRAIHGAVNEVTIAWEPGSGPYDRQASTPGKREAGVTLDDMDDMNVAFVFQDEELLEWFHDATFGGGVMDPLTPLRSG